MTEHRLSILHISDLHARSRNVDELPDDLREKRRRAVQLEAASREKVLGDEWTKNLRELYPNDERPDLVCFTGDVADWGLGAEYDEATKLIDRLVDVLGVERSRIYVVPGNHDVRRTNPKRDADKAAHQEWENVRDLMWSDANAASKWLSGGSPPRAVEAGVVDTVMGRTSAFWRWVEYGLRRPELLPGASAHGRLGYHHVPSLPDLPFTVHVIGLDSAWLAGDDNDQGKLWLTEHQRDLLLRDDDGKPWSGGFRIALVHHPIEELAQPERDATRRELANAVDLLLHGHQHDPVGVQHIDLDGRVLRVLAAGCLFEGGEGSRYKNGCHRIDVALDGTGRPLRANIHFRGWSSRGHWHSDSSLYRTAKDGRLGWHAWGSAAGPQLVSNLGERPRVFEGRDDELAKIRQALANTGSAAAVMSAVVGLGGVGKSRLALEYAFVGDYDVRWWVRAGAIATLQADLVELGHRLGIVGQVDSVERAVREVVEWLSRNERWILVLDNATGPDAVRDVVGGLLRGRCPGHVLITSRAQAWRSIAVPIEITTLSAGAAKTVLLRRSGREDDGSAATIAKELGHLPLALIQAGAYVEATGCSLHEYLGRLEQHGLVLFQGRKAAPGDYEQTVAVTWDISLEAIRAESGTAAVLLDWLSFLDPDGVPLRLLLEHLQGLPGEVAACFESELVLDDAIAVLRRFSMVDRVAEPEHALRVHRLVQQVTRERLGDEQRRVYASAVVSWVQAVFAYVPDETAISDVPEGIGEQLMAVSKLDVGVATTGRELTRTLIKLGDFRIRKGMLAAARVASDRSVQIADGLAKADPHSAQAQRGLAHSLSMLGNVEVEAGNLAAARDLFVRVLQIADRLAKADPHSAEAQRDLAVSLDKLGGVEVQAGNLAVARDRFVRFLQIADGLAKADPHSAQAQRDLSVSLSMLGGVEVHAGNLAAARDLFVRSLHIAEGLANADPHSAQAQRDLSVSLDELGGVEVQAGNLAAARDRFVRALHIAEALAKADPHSAEAQSHLSVSLERLGGVEVQAGNLAAARDRFVRALHIAEALAKADPHSAQAQRNLSVSLNKLGGVEVQAGNFAVARDLFVRDLHIADRLAKADPHSAQAQRDLSVSLERLGSIELWAGDLAVARDLFVRVLQIAEGLAKADPHSARAQRDLAVSLDRLGNVEVQAGDLAAARDLFVRSLQIAEGLAKADPHSAQAQRDLAIWLNKLGGVEAQAGNLAVARERFVRSLQIADGLAKANPQSAEAQRDLSISLERLGDVEVLDGNLAVARDLFVRDLYIAEGLANADPHSALAQRDLSVSLNKLGGVEVQAGNLAVARDLFVRSLQIREELANADPHSAQAQRDLSVSLSMLGGVEAQAGDVAAARDLFVRSQHIAEGLGKADPHSAEPTAGLVGHGPSRSGGRPRR
jgi:tetratricopeptide (TPR) repeat protein/predicted phosphodiesterase